MTKRFQPPHTLYLPILGHHEAAARLIGRARRKVHDDNRLPSEDRGEVGNADADYNGALAEFVIIANLEVLGMAVSGYEFYSRRPVIASDFQLGTVRYDIKSIRSQSGYLYANEAQRLKGNLVHFLLPCIVSAKQIAVFNPIPYGETAGWDLRGSSGSEYRSLPISVLRPLSALRDLPDRLTPRPDGAETPEQALLRARHVVMNFGKHKGKMLKDVPAYYLDWCRRRTEFLSPELFEALEHLSARG
jgi:uncharacterized protein (DUF3820 family)